MSRHGHFIGGVRLLSFALTFCCLMTAVSSLSFMKRQPPGENLLTYRVGQISQQRTEDGFDVQIQLRGSEMPQVYILDDLRRGLSQPQNHGMPSSQGLVAFHSATGQVAVIFLHPRGAQVVALSLHENSAQELTIPDVEIFNKGGRTITFEKGSNAIVNLTIRHDHVEGSVDWAYAMAVRNKTDSQSVYIHLADNSFPFDELDYDSSGNEMYEHFRLMTSSGDVEGLLLIVTTMHFDCRINPNSHSGPCMEVTYAVGEAVPVYQSDHAGPFPEHYIGLVKLANDPDMINSQSNEAEICPRNRRPSCADMMCFFVGDRPSPVQFFQTSGDLIPFTIASLSNGGFFSAGKMEIDHLPKDVELQFHCESFTDFIGLAVNKRLIIVDDAKVERIDVNWLENGTVEVTCTAKGTPAPDVSFINDYQVPISTSLRPGTFHISHPPTDNSTAMVVLTIFDPDEASNLGHVLCLARNTIRGQDFQDINYEDMFPDYM